MGKSKNPRCFKGVKSLPVDYYSNANAWKWDLELSEKLSCW
jgi:hypothetical protein